MCRLSVRQLRYTPEQSPPAIFAGPAPAGSVVINEILAHTDPPDIDSIELYNQSAAPVDISGWYITDDSAKPVAEWYRIPANTFVPGRRLRVFTVDATWSFHFSEFGEIAYLYQAGAGGQPGALMDSAPFGVSPNGVSLGRYVASTGTVDFPLQSAVTLGAANAGPLVGPLVISEIMYHPKENGSEYIVVTNITDAPVPLFDPDHPKNTWKLAGAVDYTFAQGIVVGPRASLVVAGVTPEQFRAEYYLPPDAPVVGPYSGKLNNSGERVALTKPQPPETTPNQQGIEVAYAEMDVVDYRPTSPWPAGADGQGSALLRIDLSAYGNDAANWQASTGPIFARQLTFLPLILR